jgi:hypothetical protein
VERVGEVGVGRISHFQGPAATSTTGSAAGRPTLPARAPSHVGMESIYVTHVDSLTVDDADRGASRFSKAENDRQTERQNIACMATICRCGGRDGCGDA